LLSSLLMIVMAVLVPIEDVAAATDLMFLFLFLQVNLAAVQIRKRWGDELDYGFRTPWFPFFPYFGVFSQIVLAVFLLIYSPLAWLSALVWIGVGLTFYYRWIRPRLHQKEATPVVLRETYRIGEDARRRVLVALSNPQTLPFLTRFGAALARSQETPTELMLLHVIHLPRQLPLRQGERFLPRARELLEQARAIAQEAGVDPQLLVRISHRPTQAILDTVMEDRVDHLVLGWRGPSESPHTLLGRGVETILSRAGCHVLLVELQQRALPTEVKRILIPVSYPPQLPLLLEAAQAVCSVQGTCRPLEVVHFHDPDLPEPQRSALEEAFQAHIKAWTSRQEQGDETSPSVQFQMIPSRHPFAEILSRSRDVDLVVLGTGRQRWLDRQVLGLPLSRLIFRMETPVILVRGKDAPFLRLLKELRAFLFGEL
ncbi:MAG: universal stress protein, partial [Candidatus Hydrothermae bacterium]|nr:universal stress protein [Candidatus Hydrothermae bacterium]